MICIVLHTHLPYVLHHGNWPHGSDWLCEAVAECYLPLLMMCNTLSAEGINPGLTFDISPVLCEQLAHPDFPKVFHTYCTEHAKLAEGDRKKFIDEGAQDFAELAGVWSEWYITKWEQFQSTFSSDIIGAFRSLQDRGLVEIITCGATHGYLPLLAEDSSVEQQIGIAVGNYQRHFQRAPRGIWLPECAYRPAYSWRTYLPVAPYSIARPRKGVEQFLQQYHLRYFVTDEGALTSAIPLGVRDSNNLRVAYHDTYGRIRQQLDERSVMDVFLVSGENHRESAAVFTRHRRIALQVWSGESGYPGDPDYLDFHKKYYRSALRYWRVTDNKADMQWKQPYVPEWAENKARQHAVHFCEILEVTLRHRMMDSGETGPPPTICLPFDTELFGHWWFEGPLFLEHLLREIHTSQILRTSTLGMQYDVLQPQCEIALPESSWGRNGNHEVWMNPDVQWTWEREYLLEHRMQMLLTKHSAPGWDSTMLRFVRNAFRQMLLAQASDWQFLISTFASREYAEARFHSHASDALKLCDAAERYATNGSVTVHDEQLCSACEERDGIFIQELEQFFTRQGVTVQ